MHPVESLTRPFEDFFRALGEADGSPAGLRGRIEIYRYAYFERIRASIEEDYPLLFEFLETLEDFPGGIDAATVTRDLLARNHPSSWTLAEASRPVLESVAALLADSDRQGTLAEARRLAALDEAELIAGWVEEWPVPAVDPSARAAEFAAGRLKLARTKTWREAGERVFWRSDAGTREAATSEFSAFSALFPLVEEPIGFADFGARAGDAATPAEVSRFLERGIGEGWLRLINVPVLL